MQKFSVDIQCPGVPLVVHAKQGDTARAVQVSLYDGGVPYVPPDGTQPIVFYKTSAGMGNYSERVTLSGNTLDIPLIAQMLTSPGGGLMCVALVAKNKGQLATWNMEVHVECVPGMDSKPAKDWYTAMAEYVAQTLANVDQAKAEVQKAKDEVQRAKAEADRAASLTSRYDKDLAGSTVVTASLVNCNLLEGTPLHVVSHIEPVQEGSGDPSPDNVRPIKGFAGAKLAKCSKNLLQKFPNSISHGVTFITNEDGSVVASGVANQQASSILRANIELGDKTAFLSGGLNSKLVVEARVIKDGKASYVRDMGRGIAINGGRLDYVACIVTNGETVDNVVYKPMLVLGTSSTPYEPYQGNECTVQFGQTVYGGSYDWDKGELTLTHKVLELKVPDMNNNEDFPGWNNVSRIGADTGLGDGTSYQQVQSNVGRINVNTQGDNKTIFMSKSVYSLKQSEWKRRYPDLTIQVLIPYQKGFCPVVKLAPQQVLSLSGTNNLHSNTGDTTVSRKQNLFDMIYPVGSLYMSMQKTNPAALFGGTWEQIQGRFLLGASDKYTAGSTGGEETHTLTTAELPNEELELLSYGGGAPVGIGVGSVETKFNVQWQSGKSDSKLTVNRTNGGQPHNNMPPYLAVYIWKRIK